MFTKKKDEKQDSLIEYVKIIISWIICLEALTRR